MDIDIGIDIELSEWFIKERSIFWDGSLDTTSPKKHWSVSLQTQSPKMGDFKMLRGQVGVEGGGGYEERGFS